MKTTLQIDDVLLERFQEAVLREHGKLKGAQSEALEEAVKLWLAFKGVKRYFAIIDSNSAKIADLEHVKKAVINALRERKVQRAETLVFPLFDSFDREDLTGLLEAVQSVLGKPTSSDGSIEDLEHSGDWAVYSWRIREGEHGYSMKFVMRMSFNHVGYSRIWSREILNVRDLQEKLSEKDLAYEIKPSEPTYQPIQE